MRRRRRSGPTGACSYGAGAVVRRCRSSAATKGSGTRFFSSIDDEIEYDNLFIFDEVGWNFEPSELSAAFGLVQLEKLEANLEDAQAKLRASYEYFGARPDVFVPAPNDARSSTRRGTCSRS